MPHDRFFLDTPFALHETVDLRAEAHHLRVMRLNRGETLELVNGQNQLAHARLLDAHNAQIMHIENHLPPPPLVLCQALPRANKLDFIVEKGTELGMTELWLFPGVRSDKEQLSAHQKNRLEQLMIGAIKQCGRYDLPRIECKPPLAAWSTLPHPAYFGDLVPCAPSLLSQTVDPSQKTLFFVGPESGFSPEEIDRLRHLGAQGVSLHPWTLRTETASLAALTLLTHLLRATATL